MIDCKHQVLVLYVAVSHDLPLVNLIHWSRDKMATILQTFPDALFLLKIVVSWLKFHWNLFQEVQKNMDNKPTLHDDIIQWKHFSHYWPFVRGIHRSLVNSPHKGHWHEALMFSLIYAWTNGWANNHDAGDRRRHYAHLHYEVTVMGSDNIWVGPNRWQAISEPMMANFIDTYT